jgi:hypothetical protein
MLPNEGRNDRIHLLHGDNLVVESTIRNVYTIFGGPGAMVKDADRVGSNIRRCHHPSIVKMLAWVVIWAVMT